MRIGSVSLLVLSAFALAACEGIPTTGSSASNASLDLCGLACPDGTPDGGGINDADGDGIDDGADGDNGTDEGGNTTNLDPATADVTIALQKSKLSVPTSGTTALSTLTSSVTTSTTTSQILGASKPPALTFRIDTNNSSTNGNFATPVLMPEHVPGTIALDITGGNNGGAGAGYREYRAVSGVTGAERNEVLQVWAWNESYATQYRNANGGEAPQQAWSFGGNRTPLADVPGVGSGLSASYTGRFVATAKSENWLRPSDAIIEPNALWRVQGAASINADFDTASVTGTLTPETWQSKQPGVVGGDYMWIVGTLGHGS